jgi:hypothetical protein
MDSRIVIEWATHHVAQLRVIHILSLALLALVGDYAWMLYMRWRMVRSFPSHHYLVLTEHKPPGPFPWPVCGNTFSLPDDKPWYYFEQLSKDYGSPLITFWLGRFGNLHLCTKRTITELTQETYNMDQRCVGGK